MNESKDPLAVLDGEPDIRALCEELQRSTFTRTSNSYDQSDNVRYCRWPGQTKDGKKRSEEQGEKAFPWDGASDTRIPMADEIINSLVDLDVTSFWRSNVKITGQTTDKTDTTAGAGANTLMDWVVNAKMYSELVREVELISQYVRHYGWAGAHITWQYETGQKETEITMEQLITMAHNSAPGTVFAELPSMVKNENAEDQVAELLQSVFPKLSKRRARKAVRDLRNEDKCEFPVPAVMKNQPAVVALCPFDELVFPYETTDIQHARVVFRRCWMTVHEIDQCVLNNEWDYEWAEKVKNTIGKNSGFTQNYSNGFNNGSFTQQEMLVEIIYAYQKALDEDDCPGIFCTVFSPHMMEGYAHHEAMEYAHGKYPFVVWRSEIPHRRIVDSRGVTDVVSTWQNEIKAQRDSICDYTSITTIPPILVPKQRSGSLTLKPAGQIPVLRPNEISFMNPPARDPGVAFKLMELIELQADKYFGRPNALIPPHLTQMRQQKMVIAWLHGWTEVFKQVLSLCVQYYEPEELFRITGINGQMDQSIQDFDINLRFNVQELQSDLVSDKIKAISQLIAPQDSAGVIDRAKFVPLMLQMIDPAIASQITMDVGAASQKMFDETNADVAMVALGNPPKLRENDPAAQTRLRFLEQIIQSNPKYQAQIGQDVNFQENLKKYAENLQFSVQQQQNAMTGRLGVNPNS